MVAAVLDLDEGASVRGEAGGEMRRGFADLHDVGDDDGGVGLPRLRSQLVGVADDAVDFGHGREAGGVDLCGASGDDDLCLGTVAFRAADRHPRRLNRRVGDRAAVDHDHVPPGDERADGLAFGNVEAAAEADDLWLRGRWHSARFRRGGGGSPRFAVYGGRNARLHRRSPANAGAQGIKRGAAWSWAPAFAGEQIGERAFTQHHPGGGRGPVGRR
jgi:hypothetical protein